MRFNEHEDCVTTRIPPHNFGFTYMYITVTVVASHLSKFFWIEELTLLPIKDDAFSAFVSVKVYVLGNLIGLNLVSKPCN